MDNRVNGAEVDGHVKGRGREKPGQFHRKKAIFLRERKTGLPLPMPLGEQKSAATTRPVTGSNRKAEPWH